VYNRKQKDFCDVDPERLETKNPKDLETIVIGSDLIGIR
jgi:hypothetical protein